MPKGKKFCSLCGEEMVNKPAETHNCPVCGEMPEPGDSFRNKYGRKIERYIQDKR